jgi:hypothetical protein
VENGGAQDSSSSIAKVGGGIDNEDDDDFDDDLWFGEEEGEGEGEGDDSGKDFESTEKFARKSAEWHRLYNKYCRVNNALDKDREIVYGQIDDYTLDDLNDEEDFQNHLITRMENETILRNSQIKVYEAKEAARRAKEWRKRGVWQEKMPKPTLPLVNLEN